LIIDTLTHARRYTSLHPLFGRAFDFLTATPLRELSPGRIQLEGDRLFVSIDHVDGRGPDGARLEAHRRHIDIQVTIEGTELFGWRPLERCGHPDPAFDVDRDVGFFLDRPDTWVLVPPAHFVVFFPEDAHAPLAGRGALKKAVVKVQLPQEFR
jgi:biofilm protein TabA